MIGSGLEMGETELEEGEAFNFQNEAQDFTVDPDIALSYIDEKLQNVLGHFQKDFEGGVSAENLGAKFGGYGSFLPTYQRSPTWSHTKCLPEAHHNYDSPRSPKKLHVEDQRQNLLVSSSASPPARSRIASGSSLKGNTSCSQSRHAEETSLRSVDVKKSVNSSNQGTLKVRIKVGSKSLSTQKNAEIYSGLGLGVSSSSSLDDSPTTTEVQFGKLKEALEASPTSILQIMTSSPGGLILSPLSEDLICLTEKKKPRERVETKRVGKTCVETSGMLENGSLFSKSNKKKSKLSNKGRLFSVELTNQKNNGNNKSVQDVGGVEKSSRKLGSLSKSSEFKRESLVSNNAACPPVNQSDSVSSGRKCEEVKPALEKSFTVGKKKSKMACTMGTQGASMSKVGFQALHKDPEKPGNRYRDFFGDVEFEDEDKESFSGEMKIPGRLKSPLVVGKRTSIEDHNKREEKLCLKFSQKTREAQENYPAAYQSAPPHGNDLSSEAPVGSVPFVQEDWVSCDKCQKWRLLPLGTNVSCLPDKWLCRMITWLPGMNRCSVPQEETTNALRALYHPSASIPGPTSKIQHSQLNNNSAVNSANMASDDAYPSQENQNPASDTRSRKRKHGLAKAAISSDRDEPNSFNSRRTSLGTSPLTNSLNSGKNLRSRLSGFAVKNFSDHKKETSSVFNSSDRGTFVKINTKQEADISGSRAFEKRKGEGLHVSDNYWTSDNCGMSSKAGHPTTIVSYDTSEFDKRKSNHHKDLSQPKKDVLPGTSEETHVPGTLVNGLLFSEKSDYKDSLGKRKATDASDQRKEKKTRISKSGGQDINGRKTTLNPSVATNSSSSMVSSLHQTKIIGQEVKGSPVESVSSSPLRYPSAVNFMLNKDELVGKDAFHDSGGSLTAVVIGPGVLSGEDGREWGKKDAALFGDKQYKVEEKVVQSMRKSGKGLSSHSKGKAHTSGPVLDGLHNSSHTPDNGEKFTGQKDSAAGTSSESSKGQKQKKLAYNEKYINKSHDKKHPSHQEHYNEKPPKRSNQAEANGDGKSHSLLAMARISTEPVSGTGKENIVESVAFELDNDDGQEAPNHRKKSESLNCYPVRHPTPKSHKARDIDVPSPIGRESSCYAGNSALKEAKALKHMADRLQNFGSTESVGLYFQAALKFLHGASLMETGSSEATEQNELMHSMHIYSSTAGLCEFCAHEYEKLKNMVAAALAYKCMEVAYLRVVYLSHNSSSKDLNELQRALQIVPPGESPCSSASDVDNLNHQATTDKAALAKVVDSSPVSGSYILAARNRSGFLRILNFTRDVNLAMEASRRSKIALTAASEKLSESSDKEILDSLKRALDFSFHDVEGFLCLVRLSMESINRLKIESL